MLPGRVVDLGQRKVASSRLTGGTVLSASNTLSSAELYIQMDFSIETTR